MSQSPEAFNCKVPSIFQAFSAQKMPVFYRQLALRTRAMFYDPGLGAIFGEYLIYRLHSNYGLSSGFLGAMEIIYLTGRQNGQHMVCIGLSMTSTWGCISSAQVHVSDFHSPP
jgi:hypothetical protein